MTQKRMLALRLIDFLNAHGFKAYLAGGCVRDELLNREVSDYDIATDALPDQVIHVARSQSLKVIPTGIDHGTVTVIQAGSPFEVTTFRHDVRTDGRHAVVEFVGATIESDAARRDFTVNAMYMGRDGTIFDFHGGREDLKQKTLRFVGEPVARIQEDYLRILRLFRFWAQLGFVPDEASLAAARTKTDGLKDISPERITSEILKLLTFSPCQEPMNELLPILFPDSKPLNFGLDPVVISKPEIQSIVRLWMALFNISGSSYIKAKQFAYLLILSNQQKAWFDTIAAVPMHLTHVKDQSDAMELVDEIEKCFGPNSFSQNIYDVLTTTLAGDDHLIERLQYCGKIELKCGDLRRSRMSVEASDLKQLAKIPEGPRIGEALRFLKRLYRLEYWTTKEEGIHLLKGSTLQ